MRNNRNAEFNKGWKSQGTIQTKDGTKVSYAVKHYGLGSEWGIDGGKISKLEMQIDGETVALYDRGWARKPDANNPAAMTAYRTVLDMYN